MLRYLISLTVIDFRNCGGITVVGFNEEINSLMKKLKARKGHGVEVSGCKQV